MNDYNSVLTTLIQASATLVGIFSIFLVLRITFFHSRQDNIIYLRSTFTTSLIHTNLQMATLINSVRDWKTQEIIDNTMEQKIKDTLSRIPNDYEKIQKTLDGFEKTYKDFPETVYFGFCGIIWLLGWGLIFPLCIIPQSNLDSLYTYFFVPSLYYIKTTLLLKGTFIFGLFIFIFYLILEYIYFKHPRYYCKKRDKIKNKITVFRNKFKKKPKTEENTIK